MGHRARGAPGVWTWRNGWRCRDWRVEVLGLKGVGRKRGRKEAEEYERCDGMISGSRLQGFWGLAWLAILKSTETTRGVCHSVLISQHVCFFLFYQIIVIPCCHRWVLPDYIHSANLHVLSTRWFLFWLSMSWCISFWMKNYGKEDINTHISHAQLRFLVIHL